MVRVKFTGRKNGAIGIFYEIIEWVKNDPRQDRHACLMELYEKYEHIVNLRVCETSLACDQISRPIS